MKKIHFISKNEIQTKKIKSIRIKEKKKIYQTEQKEKRRRLKHFVKKYRKAFFLFLLTSIWAPIFTAYCADSFIRKSMKELSEEEKVNNQINTFENIYIGCSKEWMDDSLGAPTFKYQYLPTQDYKELNLMCCVYVTDIAIVRAYFDEVALSCKAFFVTVKNDEFIVDLPKPYRRYVNDKAIGEFSYYDIQNGPTCLGGGISNGNERTFYGEVYYYMSAGNYYYFVFGTMDYGMNSNIDLYEDVVEWDDEVNKFKTKVLGVQNINDRKKYYPNTFGLTIPLFGDELAFRLLADFNGFDSFQLKDDPYHYLKRIKNNSASKK